MEAPTSQNHFMVVQRSTFPFSGGGVEFWESSSIKRHTRSRSIIPHMDPNSYGSMTSSGLWCYLNKIDGW